MLLRIIDNPTPENAENGIRIVLENNDGAESFVTESYTSPISENFHKTLAWYFKDYPQHNVSDSGDSQVVEKLIKFGQYIGEELFR